MRLFIFLLLVYLVSACGERTYNAHENLNAAVYDSLLIRIAPYVIKKPDEFSYEQRFAVSSRPFYRNFIKLTNAELRYYYETDTADLFFFMHRDLTSLYEHYRGLGGYLKKDDNGNITFLNILYHTPRFTKPQMDNRSEILFREMATKGDVKAYMGNTSFIYVPNADFYYNTRTNRWEHTANSSWKFLEDAKQKASDGDTLN